MTDKRLSVKRIYLILLMCAVTALCAAMAAVSVSAADGAVTEISINIDFGDYDGVGGGVNLPHGKAGKSYPVFSCSATDNNGNAAKEVLVTVLNPENKLVPQVKGRFATSVEGEYTINYVAVSGSVSASKTITVTVDEYVDDIVYNGENENVPAVGDTGVAVFAVLGDFSGGSGDLTEELSVKLATESVEVIKTAENVYFIPEKCGEYSLVYKVTDFTGDEKSVEKTVTVTDSDLPLLGVPSVESSLIAGETIELPHVNGLFYKDGKKYYLPVKVTFDGADVSATLKVENLTAGEHTVEYGCVSPVDETKSVKRTVTVTVKEKTVAADGKIYDKYFDFVNCATEAGAKGEYIVSVKANEDKTPKNASFAFSRALPLKYADIELSASAARGAFSAAKFIVTDSKNASEKIEVKIVGLTSYEQLWLGYDDELKAVVNKNGGEIISEIGVYTDGKKFNGFSSGKVYVSFELVAVESDVTLVISKAGSTTVTSSTVDYAPPVFNDNVDFRSVYVSYLGHKVTLPKMTAFDLLDKNVSVTLTVTNPDGTVVYNGSDGYTLEVSKSGEYSVEYVATDSSDNVRKLMSSVYVTDLESPNIEVNGVAASVNAGDEITLPTATVTDNDTAADKILTYVYVSYGNNRKKIVGETYKFTAAGEYKIRYVAYDANQNYTVVEFTVICK